MLTRNDFQQIREIVKEEIDPVKKQLDTVEIKVELVNKKVEQVGKNLTKEIAQTQEDTIDALSELINTSYNLHEKRIKKIEEVLQVTNPQQ